ncbi:hypothetical protein AQUCO_01500078v1 [Aquilegia coerulea]|uniref:F-box domain-containing protein n=1 Tax=Aquilegia coerulea TaxID=218851 RepID=A0A2G5DS10_AQUCA|nr:hypothetical protein AQUCO_01500078v1 [Aquilegia coerulea]
MYRRRRRNIKRRSRRRDRGVKEGQRVRDQRFFSWALPEDITLNILSRLPVKSLMRCRCVCKSWLTSTSTPYLINMHGARATQDHNPDVLFIDFRDNPDKTLATQDLYIVENVGTHNEIVKPVPLPEHLMSLHLVDSCNGLICLTISPACERLTYVYNPCTGESIQLPYSPFSQTSDGICGFGYSPNHDEYKFVAFISVQPYFDFPFPIAEVCTLGSDSWRRIVNVPFTLIVPPSYFYMDGALYWLAFDRFDKSSLGIGSFDLENEELHFFLLPPKIFSTLDTNYLEAGIIEGCVSVVDFSSGEHTQIWSSMNYREKESWTKRNVLSLPGRTKLMRLLGTLKNREIVFFNNYNKLVSCDPRSGQFRDLGVQGVSEVLETYVHVGTLISPVRGCGAE